MTSGRGEYNKKSIYIIHDVHDVNGEKKYTKKKRKEKQIHIQRKKQNCEYKKNYKKPNKTIIIKKHNKTTNNVEQFQIKQSYFI